MGYNLIIGELEITLDNDLLETNVYLSVKPETGRAEPFLIVGEVTDGTNSRLPSYSTWRNFCVSTGLFSLFYDKDHGLLRDHPAVYPINENHREKIEEAYAKFKTRFPDAEPHYGFPDNEANVYLVRLEWLRYWVNWALDNCDRPVFKNS